MPVMWNATKANAVEMLFTVFVFRVVPPSVPFLTPSAGSTTWSEVSGLF